MEREKVTWLISMVLLKFARLNLVACNSDNWLVKDLASNGNHARQLHQILG